MNTNLDTTTGTFINAIGVGLFLAACMLAIMATGHIAQRTYLLHADQSHAWPNALLSATRTVLITAPLATLLTLHRARMAHMRDMEGRREAAIEDAILRHPSNYAARVAAMAAHPSTQPAATLHLVGGNGGVA